jgi:hypothetical protein
MASHSSNVAASPQFVTRFPSCTVIPGGPSAKPCAFKAAKLKTAATASPPRMPALTRTITAMTFHQLILSPARARLPLSQISMAPIHILMRRGGAKTFTKTCLIFEPRRLFLLEAVIIATSNAPAKIQIYP